LGIVRLNSPKQILVIFLRRATSKRSLAQMLPIISSGPLFFPRGELIAFDFDPNGVATGLLNHVGKMAPNSLQTFA